MTYNRIVCIEVLENGDKKKYKDVTSISIHIHSKPYFVKS